MSTTTLLASTDSFPRPSEAIAQAGGSTSQPGWLEIQVDNVGSGCRRACRASPS